MKRRIRLALMAVVFASLATTVTFAADKKSAQDSTTRSVQGTVSDSGDALVNGAVVQLKDTKTLQIRSYITKDDGTYHFHGLNANVDYELKADYQGASSPTKALSSFDSRKEAVINLKLDAKK